MSTSVNLDPMTAAILTPFSYSGFRESMEKMDDEAGRRKCWGFGYVDPNALSQRLLTVFTVSDLETFLKGVEDELDTFETKLKQRHCRHGMIGTVFAICGIIIGSILMGVSSGSDSGDPRQYVGLSLLLVSIIVGIPPVVCLCQKSAATEVEVIRFRVNEFATLIGFAKAKQDKDTQKAHSLLLSSWYSCYSKESAELVYSAPSIQPKQVTQPTQKTDSNLTKQEQPLLSNQSQQNGNFVLPIASAPPESDEDNQ